MDFTLRNVLLGATLLGLAGGSLGCFALLRRQSLLGDALAHASLPGVCLAFLLTESKSPAVLLGGALVTGLLGAMLINAVTRRSRVKEDAAIGIVLSVFFGLGIVLLTHIQKLPMASQSGLDRFLFGQAATLLTADIQVMAVLGGLVLLVICVFFKEFELLCFDRGFATSVGLPTRGLELLLTLMLVVVVVVGLQTVGVVLVVATLVTPAAAARQWTERLGVMLVIAAAIGGSAGAAGALWSAHVERLPTGPVIVLCASAALVVSLVAAPRRGLGWAWLLERRVARRIREENLLKDLYRWFEAAGGQTPRPVSLELVMGVRGQSPSEIGPLIKRLARQGLVERASRGLMLTAAGCEAAAQIVRKHRLWETYLTRRLELRSDHVHRDAELVEHALTDAAVDDLERRLEFPATDPHGRPIPPRPSR